MKRIVECVRSFNYLKQYWIGVLITLFIIFVFYHLLSVGNITDVVHEQPVDAPAQQITVQDTIAQKRPVDIIQKHTQAAIDKAQQILDKRNIISKDAILAPPTMQHQALQKKLSDLKQQISPIN